MSQPDFIETQLDRMEAKLDQLLARPVGGAGGSNPTPTPSEPHPAPEAQYPADIFGPLWKLTLPVNGAQEIKQPALATYTSKYCELNGARNGVVFRAWHGGDTTSGSKNPRSELRETVDGKTEGYWVIEKGTHELHIVGAVNRLTKVKPHVVVGQLHDRDDDVVVWRLEGGGDKPAKLWLTDGDNTHAYLVDEEYSLGSIYDLKITITGGLAAFAYNGTQLSYTKKLKGEGYWKAGNYLQSNTSTAPSESTSEYSEVVLYNVLVTHAA